MKKPAFPKLAFMTHRIFRKTVILLITLSILLSTAACHLKEKTAEKATKDVVDQILEYKTAELTKYLDKNDPYYERQKVLLDDLLPKMDALRQCVDEAEMLTGEAYWPFPSYGRLLFSVH